MPEKKARELFKLAESLGWTLDRVSGSHHIFVKDGCRPVVIPGPANRVQKGHLADAILKQLKGV